MSEMSYMEKLLDGGEVEWKALGEVGVIIRGNGLPKTEKSHARCAQDAETQRFEGEGRWLGALGGVRGLRV
jgi:hypothetical protein